MGTRAQTTSLTRRTFEQHRSPAESAAPTPEPARSTSRDDKLYVVTRADLSYGAQSTQAVHAACDWLLTDPGRGHTWDRTSGSLIVLAAADETALAALATRARAKGIDVVEFVEPDYADALTAVALSPGTATRKLCSNLPLAGNSAPAAAHGQALQTRLRALLHDMDDCEQTRGQSVLAHGRSVWAHAQALIGHVRGEHSLHGDSRFKLPGWLDTYAGQLAADLLDQTVLRRYTVLHDSGKPTVRTVDADGRVHFPGHAAASTAVFRATFGLDDATLQMSQAHRDALEQTSALIAHDMDLHTCSAADLPELVQRHAGGRRLIASQLLVALAEISANAAMFGGISSAGFAAKYKHLDRRGKAICKLLYGDLTAEQASGQVRS